MQIKKEEFEKYQNDMVEWRRDFHMHPELGFKEFRTSKKISELLKSFDLNVVENFCKTAVVGILDSGKPGKVIGLRADIDALPLEDLKDVSYKSTIDGICHACGHDAHTAILLGVAKYFSENREGITGNHKIHISAC